MLWAASDLAADGVGTLVVEVHTLKPLDVANIAAILGRTGAAVTIEELFDDAPHGGMPESILAFVALLPDALKLFEVVLDQNRANGCGSGAHPYLIGAASAPRA